MPYRKLRMQAFIAAILGTRYVWWVDGDSTTKADAPFYCKGAPSPEIIKTAGCNCAGLINLLAHKAGFKIPGLTEGYWYAGGTYAWTIFLRDKGVLEPFDPTKVYAAGSLLLREYRDPKDQGHLAVLLDKQRLLHCYPEAGIVIEDTIAMDYYEFVAPRYFEFKCG